jgi:xylulokinase
MGVPVDDMTLTGGGSRSKLWQQMLADLYGCTVKLPSNGEGAALGAAMLAAQAVGVEIELPADAASQCLPQDSSAYEPFYALYKSLYAALEPSFTALANV